MAASPIRRFFHLGPLTALGIIKLITWAMVHLVGMWWPPHSSPGAALHAATFLFLAAGTLYYFLQSLLEGPGFVPPGWKPSKEADSVHLQFCTVCNSYKAPRSHHCKKCGQCILKMDHHCPWINCCVGHANHAYFNLFLLFAVGGCLQASIVLVVCMYHAIHRGWYEQYGSGDEPLVYLTLTTLLLSLLAIGMAIGVVLAVGVLFYFQIRGILRNRTTIEDWIVEKADCRHEELGLPPFVFPYDLGWRRNLACVLYSTRYDGIKWPVKEDCDEYDLTREQLSQKREKQRRARWVVAAHAYSGRWVPLQAWPRAALAVPCVDESRLPLSVGDLLRATRLRRHWMFGEKVMEGDVRGPRGWFPAAATVPARPYSRKHKPD